MEIYKPGELKKYLKKLNIDPKKSLSQNFLLDGNIIKKILDFANVSSKDLVLEVGPGPGALTEALLRSRAKVIAIEKDKVLAQGLLRITDKNLTIYCQDILKSSLDDLLPAKQKAKVISNLPYHLTTPIITQILTRSDLFTHCIVMVQLEVANRLVARPSSKDYGSITVFANFYSQVEFGFKVSSSCFFPRPKVQSAVVKLNLHKRPKDVLETRFFQITRCAFSQRRKTLPNSLRKLYHPDLIKAVLSKMGKPLTSRPEELSFEDFLELYRGLS